MEGELKMNRGSYIFLSKIGVCGIEWNQRGIERVVIRPKKSKGSSTNPPAYVMDAARRIANYLAGKGDDLSGIKIDLSRSTSFARKVYAVLRKIPAGTVVTYGELAKKVGSPQAARAVGRAMATNPLPLIIPCHRVIASDGSMCGFSSPGGLNLKKKLLANEGVF